MRAGAPDGLAARATAIAAEIHPPLKSKSVSTVAICVSQFELVGNQALISRLEGVKKRFARAIVFFFGSVAFDFVLRETHIETDQLLRDGA